MNQHSNTGKSRLFFLEFLIVLFFFLIISTVCIRLFVQAKITTDRADALSRAQAAVASAAEILISQNGDLDSTAALLNGTVVSEHEIQVHYDQINLILKLNTAAEPIMTTAPDTVLHHASILAETEDHKSIYELAFDLHIPLTREEVLP